MEQRKRLAIIGGGPSALFMFKQLVYANRKDLVIDIFEKKQQLGSGMPYSADGANDEHITNVSGNEIPELVISVGEWLQTAPKKMLQHFNITPQSYNDYKVLPRLVFGRYLQSQFDLLCAKAEEKEISHNIHFNSTVTDVIDHADQEIITIQIAGKKFLEYNYVIICTGHRWPQKMKANYPAISIRLTLRLSCKSKRMSR
ncbi:FAD/NAD(P)-binding protein [Mucilaginibacter antarcticus]|uniref:FAD/NAD(P)-binding protein n=1 Tax=Mucilaginibacter antarcticus TaxID=1855725 RepID=UPI00363179EF